MQLLLFSGKFDSHTTRQFPPTVLEWRANKKRVNLALEAKSSDGDARHGAVDSFTTSEEFAANILQVWDHIFLIVLRHLEQSLY